MHMKLTDEQAQLRDSAARFMDEECTMEFVREIEKGDVGYSPDMWKRMAELGWLGLDLPEADGGLELGVLDLCILTRELGRHICPTPFIPTCVIAGTAIGSAGSDAQRAEYMPKIIDGDRIVAFAYQEFTRHFDPGSIQLEARADGDGFVLDGTKMFVEYAGAADRLLVVARTSGSVGDGTGLTMFLVDAGSDGIKSIHTPTMARDHHYEVTFSGVRVPRADVLGEVGDAWTVLQPVLHRAALAFSSFTNGAAFEMHDMATRFAKQRVQFGRPIGQMQTIQGYLAQAIMEILGSDTLTLFTAYNMDRGRHVRGYVGKARGFAAETVFRTMHQCSQIFGGMGYMEEQDSTLYLRRGKQYELMLGGHDYWYDVAAEEMIDVEEPVQLT
jgi:alkylation response protein AidB-like acyl-CoA dehydrogenase